MMQNGAEMIVDRGLLLWLIGVPVPLVVVAILVWLYAL
jgi:hypothetical protein